MKLFALFLISLMSIAESDHSGTDFLMTPLSRIMLANIDTPNASFTVYNPGKTSGICGLILISNSNHPDFKNLTSLLNRLEISSAVETKSPMIHDQFTRFSLLNDQIESLYLNTLHIQTKDGRSISENIRAFYKYNAPIAMTVDFCKNNL